MNSRHAVCWPVATKSPSSRCSRTQAGVRARLTRSCPSCPLAVGDGDDGRRMGGQDRLTSHRPAFWERSDEADPRSRR